MKVIKDHADLQELKVAGKLPELFLHYLEGEWNDLYEVFSEGEEMDEFSLEPNGKQIVLEPGDLLPEGLGETYWVEYVEKIRLDDVEIYRMYVMEAEAMGYCTTGWLDRLTMLRKRS